VPPILCRYVVGSSGDEPDNYDEPSNMEDVCVGLHKHIRFQISKIMRVPVGPVHVVLVDCNSIVLRKSHQYALMVT